MRSTAAALPGSKKISSLVLLVYPIPDICAPLLMGHCMIYRCRGTCSAHKVTVRAPYTLPPGAIYKGWHIPQSEF
jgi:hypothetical protein